MPKQWRQGNVSRSAKCLWLPATDGIMDNMDNMDIMDDNTCLSAVHTVHDCP